eukprot:TRINITY_DN1045_c0_g1_i5.p1 TRINITY_DN1045_c0_g1~~TRINITY_DN1045_c0_g1_i5.p1  ORF type:complete len:151 (-),score=16.21 TRINITY_DN1045_c0_g1_i5:1656-2108(-)
MPGEGELEFINAVDQKAVGGGGGGAHSQSPTYPIGGAAAAPAGSGGTVGLIKQAHHPVAALFHFLFKGLAIFVYIFGGLISSNFVLICVATILLLAFDFWTVKNITGRLMVRKSKRRDCYRFFDMMGFHWHNLSTLDLVVAVPLTVVHAL